MVYFSVLVPITVLIFTPTRLPCLLGGSTREIELIKALQMLIDKVNAGEYDPNAVSTGKSSITTKLGDIKVSIKHMFSHYLLCSYSYVSEEF